MSLNKGLLCMCAFDSGVWKHIKIASVGRGVYNFCKCQRDIITAGRPFKTTTKLGGPFSCPAAAALLSLKWGYPLRAYQFHQLEASPAAWSLSRDLYHFWGLTRERITSITPHRESLMCDDVTVIKHMLPLPRIRSDVWHGVLAHMWYTPEVW
jgi:hypothetical protein